MDSLLEEVAVLPEVEKRAVASLLGALVADAAAQPLHWVYDETAMKQATSSCIDHPEFKASSVNPYYRQPCGSQSPYGDQVMVLLRSLVHCNGQLNIEDYSQQAFKAFGPSSDYGIAATKRKGKESLPISGPWANRTQLRFAELYENGKTVAAVIGNEDNFPDPDCVTRISPILVRYVGMPELYEKIELATRVMQTGDIAISQTQLAAYILEQYILKGGKSTTESGIFGETVQKLQSEKDYESSSLIDNVMNNRKLSIKEATLHFGKN